MATAEPPLVVLIDAVNISAVTSVVASAVGITEKEPVLPLITTVPLLVTKSVVLDNDQYSCVASETLVVVTVNVIDAPSLTEVTPCGAATAYVGLAAGVVLESPM